jgi:TPR repeat protein
MGPEAKIGFHAAWRGRDDTDERRLSAPGNAIVGAYMKELGFSDEFIRFAVSAPIDGMKHLTDNDIRQHGLAVSKIDGGSREREQQAYAWHNEAVSKRWKKPADYAEAVRLYKLAAEANYAGSQNNLGDLYETGTGLPKAPGLAIYWYTGAAERAEPTAYLSLSSYLPEISQDKDTLIQAAKFAILATRGLDEGHNKATAESNRRSLEKRLSSEEYAQAQVLADRWQPLFQETHLMSDRPAPAD